MSSSAERVERRLAAIFAADVAGYSRLMNQDEAGTLRALAAAREVMDGLIDQFGGRIANTAGDSVLAEFPSAVDAVQCAVAVQEKLAKASAGEPEDRRLQFRIGIHVGDVVVRGQDLLGEGVNVAARLEGLAEPGGIVISGAAHGYVRKALLLAYTDLGEQQVKNIDEPIRAYGVRPAVALPASTASVPKPLPLPDKPSIAVLPFANISGDPEQEYFADGVVEDMITALSRFHSLFVIARNSSFAYKGRAVDIKQVGRELGVRYILEGSIRRAGERIRITGQLIDAITGAHLWADRFDRALDDIFAVQDEVTASVVGAIAPRVELAEIERADRRRPGNLDAYEEFLQGKAAFHRATRESVDDALRRFRTAISLDGTFGPAYALAARCHTLRKAQQWAADQGQNVAEARDYAMRAAKLGKADAVCLSEAGITFAYVVLDLEAGAAYTSRAIALNPNLATAWLASGWVQVWLGQANIAVEHLARAMRLSPLDPIMHAMQNAMAHAHYHSDRYEEAAIWAERALREEPTYKPAARVAAASYAMAGLLEQAHRAFTRMRELDPNLHISNLRHVFGPYRPEALNRYEEGLRRAGLPE